MKPQDLRPQRTSLVGETVNVMRRAIHSGMWRDHLPGERTLCSMWQISRPTLRAALDVLRREKLIEIGHGRRTRVLAKPGARRVKTLTVADLRKMWEPAAQGRITTWKQVRSDWPAERLMLFGPGADSGTFDYFTEAVNGKAKSSRGDYTASDHPATIESAVRSGISAANAILHQKA